MTIMDMLGQSGVLAVLGMGVVFGFLLLLVIVISLAGKLIVRTLGHGTNVSAAGAKAGADSARVTAAITAAVNEYRKNN